MKYDILDEDTIEIGEYRLIGGGACPEQWDVFFNGNVQVGYLRLRHGNFTAEMPNSGGLLVYQANPEGDGLFQDDEREFFLTMAIHAIDLKMRGI